LPDGEREMFFAMDYGPQGRLYVSRGNRIDLVNSAGRTTVSYPLEGHGWATLKAAADGRHLYIGNFFSGQVAKLELESGNIVASADTGVERSLAGIAEYREDAHRAVAAKRARPVPKRQRARPVRKSQRARPGLKRNHRAKRARRKK
jgi:hypothetical protein